MPTNIQELYISTVLPLPAVERQQLAVLILQDLPQPAKDSPPPVEFISQTSLSVAEREAKRQKSVAWIRTHRAEYGGLYVALNGDELIAIGRKSGEARALARQKGYPDAFIGDVLPLDYEGYLGDWE